MKRTRKTKFKNVYVQRNTNRNSFHKMEVESHKDKKHNAILKVAVCNKKLRGIKNYSNKDKTWSQN